MADVEKQPPLRVKRPRKYEPYRKYLPVADLMRYFTPDMNDAIIAHALGTSRNRVRDFRKPNFHLTWLEADRYAIRIGLHPFFVWGDLWIEEVSPVEKQIRPDFG
ncbi:hypothetical protein UFOVP1296_71 [uncultured Caudovirales phage]|uniref:Uncharacterized protein n=1 Tax=uncultured Caudovirales phage TaxID=2100421 RepID=A0A6J5RG75_9CAUD|nr:hypothetical protein UFOVP471_23 [uncultured Caudovirales phage]CAB4169636.1 hypothetical protein UFOVP890_71 [uncultured Caudovirales phage]CAB4196293.1 hypothetical protein UFOVP1296_71 [uncultured Caudovirales phage]